MGGDVEWIQSFNTDDKMFCIYIAPNADRVQEHADCGGFPANKILEVRKVVDPTTAEVATRREPRLGWPHAERAR